MYRVQDGSVKTQNEIRKLFNNVCLPNVWTQEVYDLLKISPISNNPPPEATRQYTKFTRNGVEEVNGVWQWVWVEEDMFSPYPYVNEEGLDFIKTKEEQEKEYQDKLDANASALVRKNRNRLLAASDWVITKAFESNTTPPAEWVAYRQALRDITGQEGFPHTVTYPTQPE